MKYFKKKQKETKQKQPFIFFAENFIQDLKNKTVFRSLVCMTYLFIQLAL